MPITELHKSTSNAINTYFKTPDPVKKTEAVNAAEKEIIDAVNQLMGKTTLELPEFSPSKIPLERRIKWIKSELGELSKELAAANLKMVDPDEPNNLSWAKVGSKSKRTCTITLIPKTEQKAEKT